MTQWQWSVVCAIIRVLFATAAHKEWISPEQYSRDWALLQEALSPERNRG